jgi:hypothetical protein
MAKKQVHQQNAVLGIYLSRITASSRYRYEETPNRDSGRRVRGPRITRIVVVLPVLVRIACHLSCENRQIRGDDDERR